MQLKCLKMEQIAIEKLSVVVEHGYMQYAGMFWNWKSVILYHMYVVPWGCYLDYGVYFIRRIAGMLRA